MINQPTSHDPRTFERLSGRDLDRLLLATDEAHQTLQLRRLTRLNVSEDAPDGTLENDYRLAWETIAETGDRLDQKVEIALWSAITNNRQVGLLFDLENGTSRCLWASLLPGKEGASLTVVQVDRAGGRLGIVVVENQRTLGWDRRQIADYLTSNIKLLKTPVGQPLSLISQPPSGGAGSPLKRVMASVSGVELPRRLIEQEAAGADLGFYQNLAYEKLTHPSGGQQPKSPMGRLGQLAARLRLK